MAKHIEVNNVKKSIKTIEKKINMAKVRKALEKDEMRKAQLEKSIEEKKKLLAKNQLVKK
jgi:hypothetical protein